MEQPGDAGDLADLLGCPVHDAGEVAGVPVQAWLDGALGVQQQLGRGRGEREHRRFGPFGEGAGQVAHRFGVGIPHWFGYAGSPILRRPTRSAGTE